MDQNGVLGKDIVADAGYGSESNYKYIEDELPDHTALIPYSTMLKENSRKWQSDDRKVMNWQYHAQDDYYVNPDGVRFNFKRYAYVLIGMGSGVISKYIKQKSMMKITSLFLKH